MTQHKNDPNPHNPHFVEIDPAQRSPDVYEATEIPILKYPAIEVDLDQPDRLEDGVTAGITGSEDSRLVADIMTPDGHVGIIVTQPEKSDPVVMLLGADERQQRVLEPGEDSVDISLGNVGACLVKFTKDGKVFVFAEDVNHDYRITTRVKTTQPGQPAEQLPDDDVQREDFAHLKR